MEIGEELEVLPRPLEESIVESMHSRRNPQMVEDPNQVCVVCPRESAHWDISTRHSFAGTCLSSQGQVVMLSELVNS
jgi:hypothetical protein